MRGFLPIPFLEKAMSTSTMGKKTQDIYHGASGPCPERIGQHAVNRLCQPQCLKDRSAQDQHPQCLISLMKMKITLQHRQDLLTQDFLLLFGTETACKIFEKWDTAFKIKIIKEAKHLTQSTELCRLLNAVETLAENDDTSWDSDMACLLLLLYLLPPTAGRKRTKISPSDAVDKMVHFHKSCCSIDEHLRGRKGQQLYILAPGRTQNRIDTFYIVIDSSYHAKPPAHWVLLTNCSNLTMCSTCPTRSRWSSCTHLSRQQYTTSTSTQQISLTKDLPVLGKPFKNGSQFLS
ncbi:hypothetical protein KUCAC02_002095 [Chaenocephalus aceratus]|uniref:Uncharacterized protein n=1 Tax=Chaenocephalus aceratus TaxID=36190 RepID=A0ACB9XTJ5_CHAAC|nr:hypothetical protein KUCAC02_002095 [Chaenocephalus aceratus]